MRILAGRHLKQVLLYFAVLLLPLCCGAGEPFRNFEARNLQVPIYSTGSESVVGLLKIERIFTDYRRVGLFRIKLMPMHVIQGACFEFSQGDPGTNWLGSLRLSPAAGSVANSMEWRDLSVRVAGEPKPRLRAGRLKLDAQGNAAFFTLEDVTLQTGDGPTRVARAMLELEGQAGRIAWTSDGRAFEWDLFSEKINSSQVGSSEATL